MHARTIPAAESAHAAWYRQPVLWLGVVIFVASLAGCIVMIVLGARHADEPVPTAGQILKMPVEPVRPAEAPAEPTP